MTQVVNRHFLSVGPNYYFNLRVCLQLLLQEGLKLSRLLLLAGGNRNSEVKDLVHERLFEVFGLLAVASPFHFDPGLSIATVIDVSKHVGFIYLHAEILVAGGQRLVFSSLSILWERADDNRALDAASGDGVVYIRILQLGVLINDHLGLGETVLNDVFEGYQFLADLLRYQNVAAVVQGHQQLSLLQLAVGAAEQDLPLVELAPGWKISVFERLGLDLLENGSLVLQLDNKLRRDEFLLVVGLVE